MGNKDWFDCTLVVVLDAAHLGQWRVSWPTWAKHRPELLEWPLLVVLDGQQLPEPDLRFVQHPNMQITQWNGKVGDAPDCFWGTQREKMLSAFVHVPARHVQTEYYLKLDTDVVAMERNDDWVQQKWFENDPVYVGKGWGYTKPPWHMSTMDDWGNWHREVRHHPPLNLKPTESGKIIRHKPNRMISWCMFAKTEWTAHIASYCDFPTLPIPSQDNFIWYMAERMRETCMTTNMKKFGWSWQSRMKNIRAKAEEAMA